MKRGKLVKAKCVFLVIVVALVCAEGASAASVESSAHKRPYNGPYSGPYLNRVAFPIGGMGAGMICLEGTGAISHVCVRNRPEVFHEPHMYAALCIKGSPDAIGVAKVLEGPVPAWKIFGSPGSTISLWYGYTEGQEDSVRCQGHWLEPVYPRPGR